MQYNGSIQPGQTQYLFTYGWSPFLAHGLVGPADDGGGKVTSSVEIERDGNGLLTSGTSAEFSRTSA